MVGIHEFIATLMARERSPEFILVELGACDGLDTEKFAAYLNRLQREYRIYAFEPVPANYESLKRIAFRVNSQTSLGSIRCAQQAVGATDGETDFWVSGPVEKYRGSSSLHTPELVTAEHNWPDMTFDKTRVRCVTLDSIFRSEKLSYIDFIWCDTQGAEADIIRGGPTAFSQTKYFFTEYHEADLHEGTGITEARLLELLKSTDPGWEVLYNYGGEVLFVNKTLESA